MKKKPRFKCCICGKKKVIVGASELELNYFNWWSYKLKDEKPKNKDYDLMDRFKVHPNHWYGYIGYMPLLNDFVYWLWEKFHKKDILKLRYCKECY